ncbi:uncharacterized protein LOC135477796 [Liolophura sinensis]|uniref:uncharacterized protein LOC135477796 n=1 Tax=Liolophura sinensis TaxID=3198878 RepID=UPI003158FE38
MEGASTDGLPAQESPSRVSNTISTGRRLPRKSAPKYSSCLLYSTKEAKEILDGLTIACCNPSYEGEGLTIAPKEMVQITVSGNVSEIKKEFLVSEKMSCNFCQTEFPHRNEQKHHYRSDWHRFNLKQRIKGLNSVSEDAFETISGNISSLSGSDTDSDGSDTESDCPPRSKPLGVPARMRQSLCNGSDSESESGLYQENPSARKYPKVFLRNSSGQLISLYRCVLYHKKNPPETCADITTIASSLPDHMTWVVMMAGGGHFAAAIFDRDTVVQHKTFHRYVVRAKRGSAQGSRDSQGNAPKSGGASLRRYNEAALMQDIQDLIASWDDLIKKCDLIFLRAPSFNRQIFFGGKNPPFRKHDPRIRIIPFPTRRATYKEVRRVHEMLASIECYGKEEDIREFVPLSPRRTFSLESGHLEPITDNSEFPSPKKKSPKNKARLSPLARTNSQEDQSAVTDVTHPNLPVLDSLLRDRRQSTSSVGSSASDVDLVCLHQEISTLNLKLFEATRKPRRKKQKKKGDILSKHQVEPESNVFEEEKYHLKNSLYTACKVGDVDSLKNLLAIFNPPATDQSPPPTTAEQGKLEASSSNAGSLDLSHITSNSASQEKDLPKTKANHNHCRKSTNQSKEKLDTSDNNAESFSSHICNNSTNQEDDMSNTKANHIHGHKSTNEGQDNAFEGVLNKKNHPEDFCNEETKASGFDLKENKSVGITSDNNKESNKLIRSHSGFHLSVSQQSAGKVAMKTYSTEILSPVVTHQLLNEPIGDSCMTLLHVASKEGHKSILGLLLAAGADPSVKDHFGQTPYTSSKSKEVRNEYRRFMARFPDRYDYLKAEIPGPLTEDMEKERKKKEAERKKVQRKAKQERLKDQRAEEERQKAEENEKKRFLSLSDREKRALAAERRQMKSALSSGGVIPVLARCFHCASDMTGKVPFEYSDFKFCSTKCLKEHRLKTQPPLMNEIIDSDPALAKVAPVSDSLLRDRRQSTSSVGSSASDVDLVCLHQEISTLNLKLFEATRKPRRKKQKKKGDILSKHQVEPESNVFEEEKYHLKNSLYTACKVGDVDSLKNLLAIFNPPATDQSPPQTTAEQGKLEASSSNAGSLDLSHITSNAASQEKDLPKTKANHNHCHKSTNQSKDKLDTSDNNAESFSSHICNNSTNQEDDMSNTKANHIHGHKSTNEGQDNAFEGVLNKKNHPEDFCNEETKASGFDLKENKSVGITSDNNKESNKLIRFHSGFHLSVSQQSAGKVAMKTYSTEILSPVVTHQLLNEPIGDSCMTLLHVASKEGHKSILGLLLAAGADPSVKDHFGQTPYTSSKSKEVRNEYRRFMARFPDRYDYLKAEIPGPLTEEMEKERKKKEAERKKVQRKAKQERLKDQRAEEERQKAEENEKKRFLSLSDREKRALAAERRQVKSALSSGGVIPVLARCFHCASDMTGKVPFEYSDFKFCSTKCLKEHRLKSSAKKS